MDQPRRDEYRVVPGEDPSAGRSFEDKLLNVLTQLTRPAATTANPIHLNKPFTYDGKDLSKFKPWWSKVESYLETYAESFPEDYYQEINWTGSLTDKAQLWHGISRE
ncbi:hypothetical protein F4774DRAFT_292089 [Daldinia eschscholtzii]|nr:hypothetical protein F4774DRAFT_292089 [Daldinia eschscholtzii]